MNLVLDFLTEKINLKKEDSIIVGVSAGPDSMCLLYLLLELRKKIGMQIIVAHINHNIRKESVLEEQFLSNYCRDFNVIFESMKIEKYQHGNFHKAARDIRYNFYKKLVDKYNASYVMTAHHGDDLMETILMRLTRGSTLKGYHGISLITNMDYYQIIRPMLFVTKEEIEKFNNLKQIPYRIDSSNTSDKYTRNRYRKYVLPFLKQENANVHLKFLKFSKLLEEASNYIEKNIDFAYNNVYKGKRLDILAFLEYETFIQKSIIRKIFEVESSNLSNITDKHIDIILDLIRKNKTGSMVYLPDSLIAIVEYNYLRFQKNVSNYQDYFLELKDGLILENGMKFIKLDKEEYGNDTIHLSSLDIKLPLYVRNKKEGDYIELKGIEGRKKVSDIFIDEKVNKLDRKSYPVVVDSLGKIVWIPKLKKSKYDSKNNKKCDIIFKCL